MTQVDSINAKTADPQAASVFVYRANGWWSHSVLFHAFLSSLILLPSVWLVVQMAMDAVELGTILFFSSGLLSFTLYLFKRAQTKIRYPSVEISPTHLILNMPMYKRAVFNLNNIESPKFVAGTLYFRHLGWPVFASFMAIPTSTKLEILKLLEAS